MTKMLLKYEFHSLPNLFVLINRHIAVKFHLCRGDASQIGLQRILDSSAENNLGLLGRLPIYPSLRMNPLEARTAAA